MAKQPEQKKKSKAELMAEMFQAGTIMVNGKPRYCVTAELLDYLTMHSVHPCLCVSKKPISPDKIEAWADEILNEGTVIDWRDADTVEQFMEHRYFAGVLIGNERYIINGNLVSNLMRFISASNKNEGYKVVAPSDIKMLRNLKAEIEEALKTLPNKVGQVIKNIAE